MLSEEYWKSRCLELAKVVNRLRIHRMHEDRLLAYKIAKKILEDNRGCTKSSTPILTEK